MPSYGHVLPVDAGVWLTCASPDWTEAFISYGIEHKAFRLHSMRRELLVIVGWKQSFDRPRSTSLNNCQSYFPPSQGRCTCVCSEFPPCVSTAGIRGQIFPWLFWFAILPGHGCMEDSAVWQDGFRRPLRTQKGD